MTIILSTYWIIFSSILIFLFFIVVRHIFFCTKVKKFLNEIHNELHTELSNDYMKYMRGDIEVQDFYEKSEWVGRLYSKIFEDYRKGMFKEYSKPRKGRTKVQ